LVVAFLIMAQAKTTMDNDATNCATGWSDNATGTGCCVTAAVPCAGANWTAGNSAAWNSTGALQTATATIPGWTSIIIITAIGAALIGMVMMFRR
jgi:hypothetical protein